MMKARLRKVALLHDWLTGMRGGEKVLESFCRLWPDADIHTLLAFPERLSQTLRAHRIEATFLNRLPGVDRYYRRLLPIMPMAAATIRLEGYDLVLSTHHCVIKSVRRPAGVPHVCYCNTPMRYAWHMRAAYLDRVGTAWRPLLRLLLDRLRDWDRLTARRVTHFIANSANVGRRILEAYGRDSVAIHPPVDVDFYRPARAAREDYYLVVSALAPYKRIDLAVKACRRLGRRLVVIGVGEELGHLQALAGSEATFIGWQSNEAIRDHLQRCRALLFPGEEDFGIVPVEANACGTPVICLGRGGATETIVPLGNRGGLPATGLWFGEETVEGLCAAMERLEAEGEAIGPADCRRQAERFSRERFEVEIQAVMDWILEGGDPLDERWRAGIAPLTARSLAA